jgi:hypothetical protein
MDVNVAAIGSASFVSGELSGCCREASVDGDALASIGTVPSG